MAEMATAENWLGEKSEVVGNVCVGGPAGVEASKRYLCYSKAFVKVCTLRMFPASPIV